MSIRYKVILPYLLLTLLVAVTGVYVVTNLVTNTLSERLTNQLLEAGRVVSDDIIRQEVNHIETARIIAYTRGVTEAISENSKGELRSLVMPVATGLNVENLFVFGKEGDEKLHFIQRSDGGLAEFDAENPETLQLIAKSICAENNTNALPQRVLATDPVDGRYYYFTAYPVAYDNEIVGVVFIGTSLETILPYLKSTSLANVIFYNESGDVIATTFEAQNADPLFVSKLNIDKELCQEISYSQELVHGENLLVNNRWYRLARGGLRVSDKELGIFAVALPLEFVIETGSISRNTYVLLFTIAMLVVIAIGYAISRMIITPLFSLISTSQAITAGDLTKRSGIDSRDEIGTLADTFDQMTMRLQEHTVELEKSNQMLAQMDQTKASFIQVAAHELRTPLTLVKGYAQMLQQQGLENAQVQSLSKGILDGYERMASVVENMLDVSKIDSQTMEVRPGAIQMQILVNQLQKNFKPALEERKITLSTKDIDTLPIISADPELLKKAFYHLIINAIKYTPDGGEIIISGNQMENELEIIVKDTGIGIAKEHQKLIFEKFYQTGEVLLHSSGKTNFKGGGPGLGLAIAQGIIEAHHGKIWVESPGYDEENCPGSKFYIRIPLKWEA